ncbi:MAG: hypothetical protein M0Q53_19725 [Prolixibacteraceae bacterium]|jgi:hypothetical protein|nr:hypothetical protein [Prolixibacteraceae bacterium]
MVKYNGIPNRAWNMTGRNFLFLITFLLLAASCFSGKQDKQTASDKSAKKGIAMDAFRLSQLTVPSNAAYSSILEDFDRGDLQNIDRALIIYANNKADSLGRDSMLISFNEYMTAVMQEYYTGKLLGNRQLMDHFESKEDPSEAQRLVTTLATHGIGITYREGDFYLEPNMAFVYDHVERALTKGSRDYLKTKISLSRVILGDNNQPLSPPDSLARQVSAWEDFMVNNPEYLSIDDIQSQYIDVFTTYLSGFEQLPLFDPNTKMLQPVYQHSYIQYIEKNPNRESTKIVKKFYDLLASKGFKYEESLDTFLPDVNFILNQNPK